jgi:hypothetical protein
MYYLKQTIYDGKTREFKNYTQKGYFRVYKRALDMLSRIHQMFEIEEPWVDETKYEDCLFFRDKSDGTYYMLRISKKKD